MDSEKIIKKPKVAVLLFGQPRYINASYKALKQEFSFEDGTPFDIFAHFWKDVGFSPKGEGEGKVVDYISEIYAAQQHLNIKKIKVQDFTELDKYVLSIENVLRVLNNNRFDKWDGGYNEGLIKKRYKWGQHLSLLNAFNLLKRYEDKWKLGTPSRTREPVRYDIIIKARTDFVYKHIDCYKHSEHYYKEKADNYINFSNFDKPMIKTGGMLFQQYDKQNKKWINKPLNTNTVDFSTLNWQRNEDNLFRIGDISLAANRKAADYFFGRHLNTYLHSFLHNYFSEDGRERDAYLRGYDRHDAVQGDSAYYNKVKVEKIVCRYLRLAREWDSKECWRNTEKNNTVIFNKIEDETPEYIFKKIKQLKRISAPFG